MAETSLTIDELARETGVTVRNIRAYQSRGLLPPPEVKSRTGYYSAEHAARLQLIQEMQGEGFGLKAIKRLLDGSRGAGPEALDFVRVLLAPFQTEEPELVRGTELAGLFGDDPKALRRAEKLGMIVDLGDDSYEVPSPTLLRAGEEVVRLGVPLDSALRVVAQINSAAESVSAAFVRMFLEEIVRPFRQAGTPEEQWPKVRDALERVRPLASEALLAGFQLKMTKAVETAFGRELER